MPSTHKVLTKRGLQWSLRGRSGQIESPLAPANTAISAFWGRHAGLDITLDSPRLHLAKAGKTRSYETAF